MTTHDTHAEPNDTRPDYRHAYPLLLLVIAGAVAALTVRHFLVPATFGEHGYYRAAALDDEKARQPLHAGRAACKECHGDEAALHAKDAHATVECETCHGPGARHIADNNVPMAKADARDDCLVCHRRLDARPGAFPQVDWREHYAFVGVKDMSVACIRCHSGHEPLYLDRDLRTARLHPLIQECSSCHLGRRDTNLKKPEGHPQIFQCDYCHPALARSFAAGAHAKLNCTTCHLFIKENNYSGRIVRNTNPRFCLLCHRKADFKGESGPPTIEWPAHIQAVSNDKADPNRPCVTCHQDQIHALASKEAPHAVP